MSDSRAVLTAAAMAREPKNRELIAKVIQLQQPGIEMAARSLVERPAAQMMQEAGRVLQVPILETNAAAGTIVQHRALAVRLGIRDIRLTARRLNREGEAAAFALLERPPASLDAGAYFPGWQDSPADPRQLWQQVDTLSAADPHLGANGFVDHDAISAYFRRHGGREGALFLQELAWEAQSWRARARALEGGALEMNLWIADKTEQFAPLELSADMLDVAIQPDDAGAADALFDKA